ncbi:MAG: hypothetical protein K2X86_01950 [Cytophagaceae bacterium]|nr:hypothetical protein [Cytophagaceae bacterium]
MKRGQIRIFLLVSTLVLLFTGYLKGCNHFEYPKQFPLSEREKDSLRHVSTNYRDSLITVASGQHYKKNSLHKIIYGEHYRDLWALPVEMKVFNIAEEKGGLKILKRGGNMQTLSLRLEGKDGKKYVLRTIDKDQSKALPPKLKNRVLVYIIKDQTAALNPYGALIIPYLANAAGILHTHPELYFIPYDTRLGEYADLFEGRVAILEEFPDESWAKELGNAEDIINTEDLLAKRFASYNTVIDQKAFLKARLFDLWINDWDRHTDQWRWAQYTEGENKIYKPIPRDRDMAFYKFDTGLLPSLIVTINPKFQTFDYNYGKIKGLIKNARYIDRLVLNGMTEQQFLEIANELEKDLTDSIITHSVNQYPAEVFKKMGYETICKLKIRRNKLDYAAREYYRLLFEQVQIAGTDQDEKFTVERLSNKETKVTVENANGKITFRHIYDNNITREIKLIGLDGTDKFIVKGKTEKGILIKIYGGQHADEIIDESEVKGITRKTKVYDTKGDNTIHKSDETQDLTTYDKSVLNFDRTGIKKR